MDKQQILKKLDQVWTALQDSTSGLSSAQMVEAGVNGVWSVKDILAHVTTWEEEALKALPVILRGERPPTYRQQYGGLDAFNARMTEQKRDLSLAEVLRQLEETHRRLVASIESAPEELFARETRFRRRLRLDSYSHYPLHTRSILDWRSRSA